jgi:formyltetrahydrofolate deformylase
MDQPNSAKKTYTLLVTCPDKPGIIAQVTNIITNHGGNIVSLLQHTAEDIDVFFCRIVFSSTYEISTEVFGANFAPISTFFEMKWELFDNDKKKNVAILVSKTSHCLYELLLKHQDGQLPCHFSVIVSNHEDLRPVAEQFGIPFHTINTDLDKSVYEAEIDSLMAQYGAELIILARYMRIMSAEFTRKWDERIINIHHGFLPAFVGAKPYHQAWHKGVKIIGATAHFANENLDQGPIISQDTVRVPDTKSIQEFITMGKDVERRVLFEAVRNCLEHRVFIHSGRTFILE